MGAQLQVLGEWPNQTIWLWYDRGNSMDHDTFSIDYYGESSGIVRLARRRGNATTVLHGLINRDGDIDWYELWSANGSTVRARPGNTTYKPIRRAVERSAALIDYMLSIYNQRLHKTANSDDEKETLPEFYEEREPPRRNPRTVGVRRNPGGRHVSTAVTKLTKLGIRLPLPLAVALGELPRGAVRVHSFQPMQRKDRGSLNTLQVALTVALPVESGYASHRRFERHKKHGQPHGDPYDRAVQMMYELSLDRGLSYWRTDWTMDEPMVFSIYGKLREWQS